MRFSAPSTRRAEGSRAGRQRRGPDGRTPRARRRIWRRRQVPAARRGSASPWTGRTSPQTSPRRRRNLASREPARRSGDTSAEIAAELGLGDGADARSAYVPLARLRLAQSSRSPAGGRRASAPTPAWRSPTPFTIGRGGISPRRDSPHRSGPYAVKSRRTPNCTKHSVSRGRSWRAGCGFRAPN